jgi:hypothetical protein
MTPLLALALFVTFERSHHAVHFVSSACPFLLPLPFPFFLFSLETHFTNALINMRRANNQEK